MDKVETDTKVSDLTVGELRTLMRQMLKEELEALWDYVFALEEQMPDPDEGKTIKPEFMEGLEKNPETRLQRGMGKPAEQVFRELGLDE